MAIKFDRERLSFITRKYPTGSRKDGVERERRKELEYEKPSFLDDDDEIIRNSAIPNNLTNSNEVNLNHVINLKEIPSSSSNK